MIEVFFLENLPIFCFDSGGGIGGDGEEVNGLGVNGNRGDMKGFGGQW